MGSFFHKKNALTYSGRKPVFHQQIAKNSRSAKPDPISSPICLVIPLVVLFFISGFTALLYQVVWQRMLGLFSGSDVQSVTIVVASYLLGLGLGSLLGGRWSDRLSPWAALQRYGLCNLGIAVFAAFSRFLFYDLLFLRLEALAQSPTWTLLLVLISLLLPTLLMGVSLPLVAKATGDRADQVAVHIGLLYGANTLGSGVGTLLSGWYIIGTLGYERTVYLGAILNALVGFAALGYAHFLKGNSTIHSANPTAHQSIHPCASPAVQSTMSRQVTAWCGLVFLSGFVAISLEIIWFRVLDTVLQSIAYTYAHLLAFILLSNALGSLLGSRWAPAIRNPRLVFLWIQGIVIAYSLVAIWGLSLYWQGHHTDLRSDIGYLDPQHLTPSIGFKYLVLPFVMMVPPNLLLGVDVPLVQKAIQTDDRQIGQRIGLIQVANILGNTSGSLITGLVLLNVLGTADSLRLLTFIGLGLIGISSIGITFRKWATPKQTGGLAALLVLLLITFPKNTQLWAALHGVPSQDYFLVQEDSTGIAAVTEANQQGALLASGQIQANFPYLHVHVLLGSLPALLHPHPAQVMIIGLGSGGTAHTIGVNPRTQSIQVVELLGAELEVLRAYARRPIGQPLNQLFHDPRYQFIVGDGRRVLTLSHRQFDLIETDAIYPWRSRAGMLYSQEFFQTVQAHLKPGGIFVEWNVGNEIEQTFRHVFPYVTQLSLSGQLYVLMGSDHPIEFDRQALLTKLENPAVIEFLHQAQANIAAIQQDVKTAGVQLYSHMKDGQPQSANTDLFPRSEYYLNTSLK